MAIPKRSNRTIRSLRETFKENIMIIAGNVATYAGADYLAAAAPMLLKWGSSGIVVHDAIKTGFGVPQLSAIQDCRKVDRAIIADGGSDFLPMR